MVYRLGKKHTRFIQRERNQVKKYRAPVADEHYEQVRVCNHLNEYYSDVLFWATPNGASLSGRGKAMNKLKAEGFLPGVSDLIIFEPRGGYSCLFLEMKKADGGNGASSISLSKALENLLEKMKGDGVI